MQFSEIYPALEKGVIKGLYWGGAGALAGKWNEVVKYQYPDSLAGGGGIGIMFNQESWDAMSDRQQEAVRAATKAASKFYTEFIDEVERTEVATLAEQGIESIEWPDDLKNTVDATTTTTRSSRTSSSRRTRCSVSRWPTLSAA